MFFTFFFHWQFLSDSFTTPAPFLLQRCFHQSAGRWDSSPLKQSSRCWALRCWLSLPKSKGPTAQFLWIGSSLDCRKLHQCLMQRCQHPALLLCSYTSADVPETAPRETSSHEHHGQHVPTSVIRGWALKSPNYTIHAFSTPVVCVPTGYSSGSQLLHCRLLEAARLSNLGCKCLHTHWAARDFLHRSSLT